MVRLPIVLDNVCIDARVSRDGGEKKTLPHNELRTSTHGETTETEQKYPLD